MQIPSETIVELNSLVSEVTSRTEILRWGTLDKTWFPTVSSAVFDIFCIWPSISVGKLT